MPSHTDQTIGSYPAVFRTMDFLMKLSDYSDRFVPDLHRIPSHKRLQHIFTQCTLNFRFIIVTLYNSKVNCLFRIV